MQIKGGVLYVICPRSHYNKVQNNNKNLGTLREPHVNKMHYSLVVVRREKQDQVRICIS